MHAATGNETNVLSVPRMAKNGMKNCHLRGQDLDILTYELKLEIHPDSNSKQQGVVAQSGTNTLNFDQYLQCN